jgi:hypothetical protein
MNQKKAPRTQDAKGFEAAESLGSRRQGRAS